jgi:hypothetical protein
MGPTLQDIRYDPILSKVSVAYQNAEYIAEQILPTIPSKNRTGKYFTYDKAKFRKVQSLRGMGTPAREVEYALSQSTAYVCKDHALKEIVPVELKDQAPAPLTPEIDATENVTERLLIEKEYDLASYMKNTGNLTNNTTLSGTDQWSDYANSDPIDDIETGIESVRSNIFKSPNTLVIGQEVWNKLKHHPDLIERIKYGGFGKMTPQALADLLDIPKVIIASTGYNSANEGQTDSLSYIWGKYAWLLYVAQRPGVKQVSFGYHFQYKNRQVDKWFDKDREGTWVRVHDDYTREIITVDAAYLIKDAVA